MRKLYLDDIRKAPDDSWTIVRNWQEFCAYFEQYGLPDVVSLDHDLGHANGHECTKWMLEHYGKPKDCRVHSMNPPGAARIKTLLEDYGKD